MERGRFWADVTASPHQQRALPHQMFSWNDYVKNAVAERIAPTRQRPRLLAVGRFG